MRQPWPSYMSATTVPPAAMARANSASEVVDREDEASRSPAEKARAVVDVVGDPEDRSPDRQPGDDLPGALVAVAMQLLRAEGRLVVLDGLGAAPHVEPGGDASH